MADAQRTVEIVFQGVDKTAAATQAVIDRTSSLAGNIQQATQPIADFTAGALKLEAGLLAAGAAATAFAIKVASDFQGAVVELEKVLGESDNVDLYTEKARELSKVYGQSATDILASMGDFRQAGFTTAESLKLIDDALDLVIAGNVDAAEGSNLLVAAIKGFGAEADDARVILDLLNAVSNNYATNLGELLIGFSELSPAAKNAGLSFEQTAGILTPVIEVFRSGSEAATGMKTSLLRLQNDTPKVVEALEALGVSQRDANGELRSAGDIYFDVAEALQLVDGNQKTYLANQLVGINQAPKFLAAVDGLAKTNEIAGGSFEYLGSAALEVTKQLDTAGAATLRAKAALDDLFLVVGEQLLDEYQGIADGIAAIFNAIGASAESGNFGDLVAYIESNMGDLQAVVETVAKNLPDALAAADFSDFIEGLDVVKESLFALFGDLDLTTVEGLQRAIEGVGAGFKALSLFSAGVIDSFKPLFDIIVDVADGIGGIDEEIRSAGNFGGFASQLNLIAGSLTVLLPSLTALTTLIFAKEAGLVSGIRAASGALAGTGGLISLLGPAGLAGVVGAAAFGLGTLANKATEVATGTSISTWLLDTAISMGLLKDEATRLAEAMENVATPGETLPLSVIDEIEAADAAMADLSGSTEDLTGKVYNFTTGLWEAADAAEGQAAAVSSTGVEIVNLDYAFDSLADSAVGYVDAANDAAPATEKIAAVTDAATEATRKWNEEIAKMDHAEKLALIEAQSAITVARMQADAEKVVAAYESLSVTIDSTGESITELFGLFEGDKLSLSEKFDVQNQIELENERRQDALDLQKKLTAAQIKQLEAQAAALARGDSIITVQGDGLQPHLEAIMWELLEAIQVRVNQDGLEMLLGAAA